MSLRQIILDTETTGMPVEDGHRLIEIGAVEMIDRRITGQHFHVYLNPERPVDPGAIAVHGLDDAFLADKAKFADEVEAFLAFIRDAELIIHNAEFDVGFINAELARMPNLGRIEDYVSGVIDSLAVARQKHPGQRNSLDALCRRYGIDNSDRTLHGALLDSEILADVYLALTGGQRTLTFEADTAEDDSATTAIRRLSPGQVPTRVIHADADAKAAHLDWLKRLGSDEEPRSWPV